MTVSFPDSLFCLACSTVTCDSCLWVLTHMMTMCRPIAVYPVSLFRLCFISKNLEGPIQLDTASLKPMRHCSNNYVAKGATHFSPLPFGVVHLSPASAVHTSCPASQRSYLHWGHPAIGVSQILFLLGRGHQPVNFLYPQFTVSLCHTPLSLMPELATSHAVWPQRPWVASIVCRTVTGPMPTILASAAHHLISARCGLVKPITQIPGSPIWNCLSLPVLFHLFFWIPYLDPLPVLLFYHYFALPPIVPTHPSYSIQESSHLQAASIIPQPLSLSASTYTLANKA
ncbi:unnamed protein product [Acanthosepion pharaonis]|uniref:Uncharacterized protein n=1 Tax=Acanthosepion pharaonis TaxID=158019 RepID=A0A812ECC1_ACAPH|nr:unnamed protein product [Sepia pharaonis]